jgi:hypothetical protein
MAVSPEEKAGSTKEIAIVERGSALRGKNSESQRAADLIDSRSARGESEIREGVSPAGLSAVATPDPPHLWVSNFPTRLTSKSKVFFISSVLFAAE